MRGGVRLGWLAVVVALLLVGVAVGVGRLKESSESGRGPAAHAAGARAYDVDSGDVTLDEGLRRADLRMPECLYVNLRYAFISDGFGYHYNIYLRLESSEECVNSFLVANGMRGVLQEERIGGSEVARLLTVRGLWMDEYPVPDMGWQIGPEQLFQKFSVGKPNLYSVTALVQHVSDSQNVQVYVYAFHGG